MRRMSNIRAKGKWQRAKGKNGNSFCLLPFAFYLLTCRPAWAGKTCTEEGLYMGSKAADCLQQHDSGCAKIKVGAVLDREPNCAEALFIQSWILQYYDNKPEEARDIQQRALKLNPDLSDFWEKRGHVIESELPSQH